MTDRRFDLAALDMAGTTVAEGGAVYQALQAAVEEHLGHPLDPDVLHRWTGTSKREAVAGLLAETSGETDTRVGDDVYANFHTRLLQSYTQTPPTWMPGVAETLSTLRSAGVKVVLQTGYSRDIAETILKGLNCVVGEQVDGLVSSDEVAASRPAPYLIFHAMELTGVRSVGRVLVAGDTPNDLGAGANAGAGFVVGVLSGSGRRAELEALPHTHLLDSAAELGALL